MHGLSRVRKRQREIQNENSGIQVYANERLKVKVLTVLFIYIYIHCSKKLKEHKYDTAAKNNHYKGNEFFILFSTHIVSTHV